jgi:UDP:flavonoid glycosyltransferase YjiC (YdhE family)
LKALSQLDTRSELYVSGVDPHLVAQRCSPNIGIRLKPAPFDKVLPGKRAFVHHGGLGSSYAGLLAGVPQIVLAHNLEQAINGFGIERLGVGKSIAMPPPTADKLGGVIRDMISDEETAAAALTVARHIASHRHPDPVAEVASACARFL